VNTRTADVVKWRAVRVAQRRPTASLVPAFWSQPVKCGDSPVRRSRDSRRLEAPSSSYTGLALAVRRLWAWRARRATARDAIAA
jgi:hypothetical protein